MRQSETLRGAGSSEFKARSKTFAPSTSKSRAQPDEPKTQSTTQTAIMNSIIRCYNPNLIPRKEPTDTIAK